MSPKLNGLGVREYHRAGEETRQVGGSSQPGRGSLWVALSWFLLCIFHSWFSSIHPPSIPSLSAGTAGFSRESTQLIISTNNSGEAKYSLDLLLRWDFMSEDPEMGGKNESTDLQKSR